MSTETHFDIDDIRQIARRLDAAMNSFRATEDLSFRATDSKDFLPAVEEYCKVAEYVNYRLLHAHDRLRAGNRTDAINAVEAEPNVLDCLQELDVVDNKMESWGETFESQNIRQPMRLLSDLAEELSAEYDVKHQLATVLRSHRLLALGGGSLEQRVTTLRKMLQMDPDNKYWEADLVGYEKHCQMNLQRELATFSRDVKDRVTPATAARIKEVCRRLIDAEWRDPVDAAIVRQSQVLLERVQTMRVRQELENIGKLLKTCHEAEDAQRAETLLIQWERLANKIELSSEDSLSLDIDEARAWINNLLEQRAAEERVAAVVDVLSAMCTQSVPWTPRAAIRRRNELRAAIFDLHTYSSRAGIVSEVAEWTAASNRKAQEIERGIRLFYGLAAVSLMLMIIVTAAAAAAVLQRFHQGDIVTTLLADVERLTKEGRHEEIDPVLDNAFSSDPWLETHWRTHHLRGEIKSTKENANNTVESIENEISRANEVLTAVAVDQKGFKNFKHIEPAVFSARDAIEDQFTAIDRSIANAEKMLSEVKGIGFVNSTDVANLISKTDGLLKQQRVEFRRLISIIRDGESKRVREGIREFKDLSGGKTSTSAAGDEISAQIVTLEKFTNKPESGLKSDLAAAINTRDRGSVMSDLHRELDRASEKGTTEFLQTLSSVRGDFPSEYADDASAVIASKEAIEAAIVWSDLSSQWRPMVLGPRSVVEPWRSGLQKAESTLLPYSTDGTVAKQIKTLKECLDDIMKPVDEINDDLQPVEELLNCSILQSDVIEVIVNGFSFYTTVAAANKQHPSHFKNEQDLDDRTILINKTIQSLVTDKQYSVAKHFKMAEKLREYLVQIKQDTVGFEDGVMKMVEVVFNQPENAAGRPDVLLRAKLLTMLMDILRTRSFLNDNSSVEKLGEELKTKVGDAQWVLSRDPVKNELELLKSERAEAVKILSKPDVWMTKISDAMKDKRDELGKQPRFIRHLEYIGWANAEGDKGISVSGTPKTLPLTGLNGTVVMVISKKEEEIEWILLDCGTLKNGQPFLRSVDSAMHTRPLFLTSSVPNRQQKKVNP